MPLELRYALRKDTNKLVFVDDVPSGLQCECLCPHCQKVLVAKKGNEREHHFAHYNGADCGKARMTTLHLLAQNILQTTKQVMPPSYNGEYVQWKARLITFDEITLEKVFIEQGIRRKPDCIGKTIDKTGNKHTLWIEVRVTHKIDEEKAIDIKSLGQSCIEIDLSDMLNTDYDEQSIKERLLAKIDTNDRHWISCPKLDEQDKLLKEQEQQEHEQKQRAQCEQLIQTWIQCPTEELTKQIIRSIPVHLFYYNDIISVCDYLFPNHNWLDSIKIIPKNQYGLQVYHTMLHYYWESVNFDYKVYNNTIEKLWIKENYLTIEESIELECLVTLYIIEQLAQRRHDLRFVPLTYKSLEYALTNNTDFRKQVFMLLSFWYYHPFGCGINSFEELANHIINSYPTLIPLSLQVLKSIQREYPQNFDFINGNSLLEKFHKVKRKDVSSPKNVERILQICFPFFFVK